MTVQPESVGLSKERLQRITRHLATRYVEPGKIAGCLALVSRGGETAYLETLGLMDRERRKPMAEDTIFRIYSMSKPITSVAMMMLYEEGLFELHDPVHKFIPEWRNLRVYRQGRYPDFLTAPAARPMTIRHLLTHMSGLTYGFLERTNVDAAYRRAGIAGAGSRGTLREMVEKLSRIPLEFSPGDAWNYSVSTDVVGHLVEVISGQPLDAFLKERIFQPLAMPDTAFEVPAEKLQRFAANYRRTPQKEVVLEDDPQASSYAGGVTFFSGGGGLVSTAHDYLRFCQMLLGGGELEGARILGRKTIELMTRNHLPEGGDLARWSTGLFSEVAYGGTGFGLGFSINQGPARAGQIGSPGEYAWGGAASTIFWIDPAEELIVLFLTQLMPSQTFNFRGQLKALVYSSLVD